jgi:ribose transport system permease protein
MRTLARPAALAPLTIIGAIAVLLIAGGMLAPGFLALSNILLLFSLSAYLGIAGIGETEVILTGGIDLSIAWTITGASIVFTGVTQGDDAHLWAGLPAALAVGIGAGFVNGVGVAKLKIMPIVMTLGMNNVMRGSR